MNKNLKDKNRYLKAEKKVTELKALYIHIAIAILLIPIVIFINYQIDKFTGFVWCWFPIGGILISIILHVVTIFKIGTDWEDRKIKELMDKDDF